MISNKLTLYHIIANFIYVLFLVCVNMNLRQKNYNLIDLALQKKTLIWPILVMIKLFWRLVVYTSRHLAPSIFNFVHFPGAALLVNLYDKCYYFYTGVYNKKNSINALNISFIIFHFYYLPVKGRDDLRCIIPQWAHRGLWLIKSKDYWNKDFNSGISEKLVRKTSERWFNCK